MNRRSSSTCALLSIDEHRADFFAAGLVSHAVHEFSELGWLPSIVEHVYDLNSIVPETSTLGQFLKALFGYSGSPSLIEMLAYVAYFVVVLGLVWLFNRKPVAKVVAEA